MAQPTHGISEKQISQSLLDMIENQASSLQTGYELTPAIVTNPTNGAVEIKVGSGADSDKVLIIENTAGAEVASVTGEGRINAVNYNGYIPENTADKVSVIQPSATEYPNNNAVIQYVEDKKVDTLQSVTDRNNSTTNGIIIGNGVTRSEISPHYYYLRSGNNFSNYRCLFIYTGENYYMGGDLGTHIDTSFTEDNDNGAIMNPLTISATKVKLQNNKSNTKFLVVNTHGVGINVEEPTANLHSIGTVRHENLTNAQGDSTFTKQVVAKPDGTFGVEDKVSNRQVLYVTGRVDQTDTNAPVVTINSQDVNDAALTFTTQYISQGWYLISVASTLVNLSNYKIEAFIQDKAFGPLAEAITDDTKFEFQGSTMVLYSLRSGALTNGITANQFSIHLYKK